VRQIAILLSLFSLVACESLPEKPDGQICTHWRQRAVAICNDIKSGADLPDQPVPSTDKWVMMPPKTWGNILKYIDVLKRIAEKQDGFIAVSAEDLRRTNQELREVTGRQRQR
jgi:hypothetical protein